MQQSSNPFSGIFISYRRDDSSGHAGRLFDKLVDHFGKDRIFMDIDTIEPGEDFVTVIENAVGSCDILIAIIGRQWLASAGRNTGRLENPLDFVRLEIATALSRDIRVIPVLVQKASMPKPQDLPDDLAKFTRRNAVELSDLRWQSDVDQLISVLERVLVKREEASQLAEAPKQAEEERQHRAKDEKLRVEEEKQLRRAEEEATQRAAEERRREVEERERREGEEGAKHEAQEASRQAEEERQRRAEDERAQAETVAHRLAEEEAKRRRAEAEQEAEFRLLEGEKQARAEKERMRQDAARQRAAEQALSERGEEGQTKPDLPEDRNKRTTFLVILACVAFLLAIVALILMRQTPEGESANQNATPPSTQQTEQTTPVPQLEPTASENASRGYDLYRQQKYAEAERYHREAVRLSPNVAAYHDSLGSALYNQQKYAESESHYREAMRLEPSNAAYNDNLGLVLYYQQKYGEAERYHREAVRLNPNVARYHDSLGSALYYQERYAEGESQYREAVRLEPGNAAYNDNLGLALYSQQKYAEAERYYREAVRLEPGNSKYRESLKRIP